MPYCRDCHYLSKRLFQTALNVADFEELDPHAWSNVKNFGLDKNDRVRLVDYGDSQTRQVLRRHREAFERAFRKL